MNRTVLPFAPKPTSVWRRLGAFALLAGLLLPTNALALEVFLNGVRATGAKLADLVNCSVRFDADGNLHIISPGYRVVDDGKGNLRIEGQSDLAAAKPSTAPAAKPKGRYVLTYQPHPRVNFSFDVYVGGKLFRKIGLDTGAFTVELTQELLPGANVLRVVGTPGDSVPGGEDADIAALRIYRGDATADGTFVARKPAVWELVRAAIDRDAVDRSYTLQIE